MIIVYCTYVYSISKEHSFHSFLSPWFCCCCTNAYDRQSLRHIFARTGSVACIPATFMHAEEIFLETHLHPSSSFDSTLLLLCLLLSSFPPCLFLSFLPSLSFSALQLSSVLSSSRRLAAQPTPYFPLFSYSVGIKGNKYASLIASRTMAYNTSRVEPALIRTHLISFFLCFASLR